MFWLSQKETHTVLLNESQRVLVFHYHMACKSIDRYMLIINASLLVATVGDKVAITSLHTVAYLTTYSHTLK